MKNLERRVTVNNPNKCKRFRKKWHRIENKVPQDFIESKQENELFVREYLGFIYVCKTNISFS